MTQQPSTGFKRLLVTYYAVARGRIPGIYQSYEECEIQIEGFDGAVIESFDTFNEAYDFLKSHNGTDATQMMLDAPTDKQKEMTYTNSMEPDDESLPPLPPYDYQDDADYKLLDDTQKGIVERVVAKENVFITGSAGTGKSFLLRCIIKILKTIHGDATVAVTAPTGIAAVNIGGVTIHRWAGIQLAADYKQLSAAWKLETQWKITETLIIDEISMLPALLFHRLERIAREIRDNNAPFGGIQLILCGDFCQLEPIISNDIPQLGVNASMTEKQFRAEAIRYGKENLRYCFQSRKWAECIPVANQILLTKIYRQKDPELAHALEELRYGHPSAESISLFNSRVDKAPPTKEGWTILYPMNANVDRYNQSKLDLIPSEIRSFNAVKRCNCANRRKATILLSSLDNILAPQLLELKIGAQVILLANLTKYLVNGTQGTVIAFNRVLVNTANNNTTGAGDGIQMWASTNPDTSRQTKTDKQYTLLPVVQWNQPHGHESSPVTTVVYPHIFMTTLGDDRAVMEQIPIKLAWAITVHKSQGMSLVNMDTSLHNCFAFGQMYVALSRAVSLEGLSLQEPINAQHAVQSSVVTAYYKQLQDPSSSSTPQP